MMGLLLFAVFSALILPGPSVVIAFPELFHHWYIFFCSEMSLLLSPAVAYAAI